MDSIAEVDIQNAKEALQSCQNNKGLDSCLGCELIFNCPIRKNYVDLVYQSMNPTGTGEFEF